MAQIVIDGKGNADAKLKAVASGFRSIGEAAKESARHTDSAAKAEIAHERALKKKVKRFGKNLSEVTAGQATLGIAGEAAGAFIAGGAVGVAAFAAAKGFEYLTESMRKTQEETAEAASALREFNAGQAEKRTSREKSAFDKASGMSLLDQREMIEKNPAAAAAFDVARKTKQKIDDIEAGRMPGEILKGAKKSLYEATHGAEIDAQKDLSGRRDQVSKMIDAAREENGYMANAESGLRTVTFGLTGGSDAEKAADAAAKLDKFADSILRAAKAADRLANSSAGIPGY